MINFLWSFYLITFFIQVFFSVIYSRVFWKKEGNRENNLEEKQRQGISVVICSHNEAENLKKLIPKLFEQNYPLFEIIIVDDRSQDGTFALLEDWKKLDKGLKSVYIKETPKNHNPKKYALEKGITQATYEIILLSDADCIPQSNEWITLMQKPFSRGFEVVLGLSPYQEFSENIFLNKVIQFETFITALQYISWSLWGKSYMGVGRNLAYKKTVFQENQYFWKKILNIKGGDDDLWVGHLSQKTYKIGVCLHPKSQMISIPKKTWKDWYAQKIRHLSVSKHYSKKNQWHLGLWTLSLFNIHLLSMIGSIYLLFSENLAGFSLLIIIYLTRICIFVLLYQRALKKFRINLPIKDLFFLEVFYTFYLIFLGSIALNTRKIQWKNQRKKPKNPVEAENNFLKKL